jgi:hypothetical protein
LAEAVALAEALAEAATAAAESAASEEEVRNGFARHLFGMQTEQDDDPLGEC